MTARTQFGTREISINLMDCYTIFSGDILQFGDKLRMGEVAHLLTPQLRHARKVEVFKADGIVPPTEFMCELPLKVGTSVSDFAVDAVKFFAPSLTVVAPFLCERKPAGCLAEPSKVIAEESRVINARAIGERHVGFKTEIHTDGCTFMCLSDSVRGSVENQHDIEISDSVPLDDKPFYRSIIGAAEKEFERLSDFINRKAVVLYRVAALFEYDGRKVLRLLKLWWALGNMVKEPLVGGIKTLNCLLHGLRVKTLHLVSLCKMRFKSVSIDKLAKHPIVTFLQRKAMIPYKGSLSQHSRKMFVSLGAI